MGDYVVCSLNKIALPFKKSVCSLRSMCMYQKGNYIELHKSNKPIYKTLLFWLKTYKYVLSYLYFAPLQLWMAFSWLLIDIDMASKILSQSSHYIIHISTSSQSHKDSFTKVATITHAGPLYTADPVTGWYSGWSSGSVCVLISSVWGTWTTVGAGVWNTGQEVRLTLG